MVRRLWDRKTRALEKARYLRACRVETALCVGGGSGGSPWELQSWADFNHGYRCVSAGRLPRVKQRPWPGSCRLRLG